MKYQQLTENAKRAAQQIAFATSKGLTRHDVNHCLGWNDYEFQENGANDLKLTKKDYDQASKKNSSISHLREVLSQNSTIYTVTKHVSQSGMSRRITFLCSFQNSIYNLDSRIAAVLGYKQHKDGGLIITGCGMDMGFHVVNSLESALNLKIKHNWI